MNANGAGHPTQNRLSKIVQVIVQERLARDPHRFAQILADAEAAAWEEVTAAIKESMKAAILAQLEMASAELPSSPPALPPASAAPQPAADEAAARPPEPSTATSPAAINDDQGAGIYVYGVVERGAASLPILAGVATDTTVRLHVVGELAAVVSDVPLQEFGQSGLEANLGDLAWLEQSVRRHQAVLDQVRAVTALAPMKFATIYLNTAGLDAWLSEQQQSLRALLAWLRNRQEWGLKVLVDRAALADHVAAYSETLRDLRTQIEGKSQGAAYFLVRRIQEVTGEEVERVSFALADEVHHSLAGLSVAAVLNVLPTEDVEPDVQMVLNSAYLVADAQVATLQHAVDDFAAEHAANGFRLQLTGPWPAYNFVAMTPVAEEPVDDE